MASSAIDFVNNTSTNTSGVVYNPKGVLGKDDFLKLMMTQLKYQDPTSPMDTDKMLAQTSDMAMIESQANMQKELENMVKQFKSTANFQLISAVGKLADTGLNAVQFKGSGAEYKDVLYFEEPFENGILSVLDSNGNTIRTINLTTGNKGLVEFTWDGRDENGIAVPAGVYSVKADYTGDATGDAYTSYLGVYPIESVVLNGDEPKMLLGGHYYALDEIVAIKDRR